MKNNMHTSMDIHVELKREIHTGSPKLHEGSLVTVVASVSFRDKNEKDLEDCLSAIKNYITCFDKQAEEAFPKSKGSNKPPKSYNECNNSKPHL